nr:MAG TPA: hypothetical protein [Bacteriophage sp.]
MTKNLLLIILFFCKIAFFFITKETSSLSSLTENW